MAQITILTVKMGSNTLVRGSILLFFEKFKQQNLALQSGNDVK